MSICTLKCIYETNACPTAMPSVSLRDTTRLRGNLSLERTVNELTTTVEKLAVAVDDLKLTNEGLHKRADERLSIILEAINRSANQQLGNPALAAGKEENGPSAYLKNPHPTAELNAVVELVVSRARERVGTKDKSALHNSLRVSSGFMRSSMCLLV